MRDPSVLPQWARQSQRQRSEGPGESRGEARSCFDSAAAALEPGCAVTGAVTVNCLTLLCLALPLSCESSFSLTLLISRYKFSLFQWRHSCSALSAPWNFVSVLPLHQKLQWWWDGCVCVGCVFGGGGGGCICMSVCASERKRNRERQIVQSLVWKTIAGSVAVGWTKCAEMGTLHRAVKNTFLNCCYSFTLHTTKKYKASRMLVCLTVISLWWLKTNEQVNICPTTELQDL